MEDNQEGGRRCAGSDGAASPPATYPHLNGVSSRHASTCNHIKQVLGQGNLLAWRCFLQNTASFPLPCQHPRQERRTSSRKRKTKYQGQVRVLVSVLCRIWTQLRIQCLFRSASKARSTRRRDKKRPGKANQVGKTMAYATNKGERQGAVMVKRSLGPWCLRRICAAMKANHRHSCSNTHESKRWLLCVPFGCRGGAGRCVG